MGLREWLGLTPVAAKAVTGTGAYWMETGTPLRKISRDPLRLMAEAQKVYHTNEWVHAAESLIDGKFATVPWHLERDGETVEEGVAPELTTLLRNPSPSMTRTHLWRITCRHMGLTGNAFWYLDQQDTQGIPVEVLYLNPSRMTPAVTERGVLRGWIVDADRPNGVDPVPLDVSEVIHFVLDPPDYGHYGIGKVEAAWRKIGLSNAAGSFAEGTLLTGGRKAHMIWPGEGITVEGDSWDAWVNNLRNIQEDGSFTRRLTANRFPVGSLETGQTVTDLKLPELAELSREDLLALWGVPASALGITQSRGLNSGETQKYEEAALWQNAIEPRLTIFAELVQEKLVEPFGYTLILETPEFDDSLPLYEIATKAITVPHKADELRALVGLDPLDEAVYGKLGQTLLLGQQIVEFSEAQPTPPQLLPFTGGREPSGRDDDAEEMPSPGEISGKAKLVFTQLRERLAKQYQSRLRNALEPALEAQRDAIAQAVKAKHAHLTTKPADEDAWWNEEREHQRLYAAIEPAIEGLILDTGRRLRSGFFASVKADDFMDRVRDYVRLRVGERIRGINQTTRTAIKSLIASGVTEGLSPAALASRISEATQFNEARAELISRTETMLAYNDAAIGTYRAFDVEEVQAIDGDLDDECAARNGNIYSLAEAAGITDHPNGTLDWVPVVKASRGAQQVGDVTPEDLAAIQRAIAEGFAKAGAYQVPAINLQPVLNPPAVNINVPEQPAPIVNVSVPEQKLPPITVEAPVIPAPVVNVAAAKAALPAEMRITEMPRRVHSAIRDKSGKITGSVEEDA